MYYTPENCFRATRANLGHVGPFWAILMILGNFRLFLVLFWVILGPPWIPKRPRGGTIRLISMYFTCEKCFRVPWTLSGHLLARSSISPSGGVSWTNNLNFAVVKSFWWSTKAKSLSKCKMVLEVYFRPFWAKSKEMFFFFQKLPFLCLAFFVWLF